MKALSFVKVIFPFILISVLLSFSTKISPLSMGEICRLKVLENISAILVELNSSKIILVNKSANLDLIKKLKYRYETSRKFYKEIEFFTEYYSTLECKLYLNGPLVPKVDIEFGNEAISPHGFQVIEENLYVETKLDLSLLLSEYNLLIEHFSSLKQYYQTIEIEDHKLVESFQLHIVRIMCLTLNGYDCTINKQTIVETKFSLNGIKQIIEKTIKNSDEKTQKIQLTELNKLIKKAQSVLLNHTNSDTFDRLNFTIEKLNPIYQNILQYKKAIGLPNSDIFYAVNLNEENFFGKNGVNKQFFSVYKGDTINKDLQAELGKVLFYDPILSGNNKRACASCHNANKAFTDGKKYSLAFDGAHMLKRNSPTLINAAYQKLFFHDGRVFNLESQADEVFNNAFEMQSNAVEILEKLKQSPDYNILFKKAFKGTADSSITFYAVIKSIAEFIKQLDSKDSKFDQYLNGNKKAMTKEEINGYNLFAGKALCASCHFFPLFNGTVPPFFNDNEFEVLGVPEKENSKEIDSDIGREAVSKSITQRYAFKTPTLRNIELTAPYMHNGAFKSIDSVLTFYNRGGGVGLGIHIANQTLPFDSLGLTKKELLDLKKFLLCLTDTSSLPKPPKQLPRFNNQNLNIRKVGGEY